MQDRRISFADLWLGLAMDREYGPGCEELLNKTLARHGLTTKNFPGPVNSLGCHNNLVRIWLGYEVLFITAEKNNQSDLILTTLPLEHF